MKPKYTNIIHKLKIVCLNLITFNQNSKFYFKTVQCNCNLIFVSSKLFFSDDINKYYNRVV